MTTNDAPSNAKGDGNDYDGLLMPFADFMNVLGEQDGIVTGVAERDLGVRLTVFELSFDLPMEMRVFKNAAGALTLRSGPPTQRMETTVFPVLHRLQVRLVLDEAMVESNTLSIDKETDDGAQ